jgi:hypothetical protein
MRPGHLNVFDGLRMTTEHMNYLQGSFHSAVQDLRGILGLGMVHQGLEVAVEGSGVTIQPGLAFDHQGNRIVLDAPATIELNFAAGETTKYVCVKYDQIEDGEVEGRFTLVWDSAAVVLLPELPQPADNMVPLARVDRVASSTSVRSLSEKPVAGVAVRQGVARLSHTEPEVLVSLDFELLSLSCYSTAAHGEATFAADGVSQFVVAGSKLMEDAVGCVHIETAATEMLITASRSDSGFRLSVETKDQGEVIEWEALVAWKALGESRG